MANRSTRESFIGTEPFYRRLSPSHYSIKGPFLFSNYRSFGFVGPTPFPGPITDPAANAFVAESGSGLGSIAISLTTNSSSTGVKLII